MISRRDFHRLALGAGASSLVGAEPSVINGVQLGLQSYSFRDRPLEPMIDSIAEVGLTECELWQGHVEPNVDREALRKWRTTVPIEVFRGIRRKFNDAGIQLYAYNYSFRTDFTDQEIARGFEM